MKQIIFIFLGEMTDFCRFIDDLSKLFFLEFNLA